MIRSSIEGTVSRLTLTLLTALLSLGERAVAEKPIDIGSRRELFVDRLLVDRMDHVELRMHHLLKATLPKSPLPVAHYITVIKDKDERGDLFRAYWRGSDTRYVPGRGEATATDDQNSATDILLMTTRAGSEHYDPHIYRSLHSTRTRSCTLAEPS